MKHPKHLVADRFGVGSQIGRDDLTWFWEIQQWFVVPGDFSRNFLSGQRLDATVVATGFEAILKSDVWRAYFRESFESAAKTGIDPYGKTPIFDFYGFSHVLTRTDIAFTTADQGRFWDAVLSAADGAAPDSDLFKGRVLFEASVLHDVTADNYGFLTERAGRLAEFLRANGSADVLKTLELFFKGAGNVRKKVFANGDAMIAILDTWHKNGILDDAAFDVALDKYVFSPRPELHESLPLEQLSLDSAYVLWRHFRSKDDPRAVFGLLEKIAKAFRVEPPSDGVEALTEETRRFMQAGVKTAPGYGKFMEFAKDGFTDDLRRLIGVNRDIKVGDPEFAKALGKNYADVLDFVKLIFNPDGQGVAAEFRGLVKYHSLDVPAESLLALFPEGALSSAQSEEIWREFSAKRANRPTDTFFETRVYPHIKCLPEAERAARYREILDQGKLRSERLKSELMTVAIHSELTRLSERAGQLSDRDVRPLIETVTSRIPDSSRFRDDLLEKIAWKLELSESQLAKFIEPLKSFNFHTMNPLTVNLLSALSVTMEKLKNSEKLALIQYFKEPKGSLKGVLPWLARFNADVNWELLKWGVKDFDWMDHLESFVRDAGEGDRLVLIELLVGSRGNGLWHADEKWRAELYELAGLEPGTTKRKLFDAYLLALPAYEHSVTLSYLIATQGEGGGGSELLRILETFDTPGIKFAQMASVLGIFGPERSEELASAKDRALPPTRSLVYEQLKKHLTAEEFSHIKHVRRLLGSGSVKFVVLVEYDDGTKEAVSIRRPFLDERIASTMDIVKLWSDELRKDAEFSSEYDFDYYLDALRLQLAEEIQFSREVGLSQGMADEYAKIPEHKGWGFEPVRPSMHRTQSDHILHFMAVEGAVPFDELSEEDKIAASELVVAAELHLLFDRRHFDADRHMGNFLFDPKTKRVYPIDMGQAYELEGNGWFSPGDPYAVAEILYGVTDKDPERGAATLARVFLRIEEDAPSRDADFARELSGAIAAILKAESSEDPARQLKMKTFKVLAELNKKRVHLPLHFTMGVVKGLMIVLNEKYAKAVDPEFITSRLEGFVRCQMTKGFRYKAFDWVRGR